MWTIFGEYDVIQMNNRKVNEDVQCLFWLCFFIQRKLYLEWKKKYIYIYIIGTESPTSWGQTKRGSCHF